MDNFVLHLKDQKRDFSVIPPIWNIAYRNESLPWLHSVSESLQFCFRFSGRRPSLKCSVNGIEHDETYPHLHVKRPGDVFDLADLEDRSEVLYFTYQPDYEVFFDNSSIPQGYGFYAFSDRNFLTPVLKRLFYAVENSWQPCMYDRIDLCCLEIVQEFFAVYRHAHEQTPPAEKNLRNIASYLQIHYDQPIDYDKLARRFGLSMRTFSRHWRKYFNTSPAQYVLGLRLEEAKRLLAETNYSTVHIAELMNYNSNSYFCQMFRRMTGLTPLKYRRMHREKKSNTKVDNLSG